MSAAPLDFARIRAVLHATAAACTAATVRLDADATLDTELAAAAAVFALIAPAFPPAAILADLCKIAEGVAVARSLGLTHDGQPGDPAMTCAAGDKPGGR